MPKFEDVAGPRDGTQEFKMYNGAVKSGSLREDPRPVRPRDGYRDGSPRGNVIPAEFGADNRARSVSLTGEHCEGPPCFPSSISRFVEIGVEISVAAARIRSNNKGICVGCTGGDIALQ